MRTRAVRAAVAIMAVLAVAACTPGAGEETALAKIDGWAGEDDISDGFSATLDVAYDAASAQRLWDDNVSPALPEGSGDPDSEGIYGDISDVDFDAQVVVMVSSGESGSCPEWITDIELLEGNVIALTTNADQYEACTADWNPYRLIMAVDRDALPPAAELDGATLRMGEFAEPAGAVREYN